MGIFTELIFGAEFKSNTPKEVIDTLKYMVGDLSEKPENLAFETTSGRNVLKCSSYCFGVNKSVTCLRWDNISKAWSLSSRSNLKNYEQEITQFLNWIKPYIETGSGLRDMYAITIFEEESEPTIYYLKD